MKKHRQNLGYILLNFFKHNLAIKLTIILVVFAAYFTIDYLRRALMTSDYFNIKDVVASDGNIFDFSYFKGRNIFSIDLQKESGYITAHCPAYRKIRLARVLPNRIFIDFIKRNPVGIIRLYRLFCVDGEGALFDLYNCQSEYPDLPLILGLETKIFGPKLGKKYNIKELNLALNVIKELKTNKELKDYKIKKIDVTNISNVSFFMRIPFMTVTSPVRRYNYPALKVIAESEWLEVKLDQGNFKEKIDILATLLSQSRKDLVNIKYIDLRFKDPVIKFKDNEKQLQGHAGGFLKKG